ncbi:hypothetical protein [Variovorax sp. dw_954]|uniref:hypothetical protein n=1 Tax=Variovorax sp. dw_954 TaxID=2720078 RepID=UPI001BD2EF50|nr:hypothetical protein [Variovorax sp. dw_954]
MTFQPLTTPEPLATGGPIHPALLPIVVALANFHEAVFKGALAGQLPDVAGAAQAKTLLDLVGEALDAQQLRNALDHIAKTARNSRTSTRRLRWIEQRALFALEGKPYDNTAFDLPQNVDTALKRATKENIALRQKRTPRPLADWHEDYGAALWWAFPVNEAPYSGSPLSSDWPGYHTHWTPIVVPAEPLK